MRDAIYTITGVDVSSDLASAKVFVTVQGDEETFSLVMEGLQRASGFPVSYTHLRAHET